MKYTPYSYSKLSLWQQCPRKFYFRYIQKIPCEPSIAIERGDFAHFLIEHVLKGDILKVQPKSYQLLTSENKTEIKKMVLEFCKGDVFQRILDIPGTRETEAWFALDKNFNYSHKKETNHLIGKIDLQIGNMIFDWKTGKKPRGLKDEDQLDLYALQYFMKYPEAETCKGSFVFIEHNYIQEKEYTRDDVVAGIIRTYSEYIRQMETDNVFECKESPLCGWCEYMKACPAYNS